MECVQTVVIGAGVVGLAIARALARSGLEVVILQAEGMIGSGASARNSEVIHAGIYYPKDSLKAWLCVAGKQALYAYVDAHHISHKRCGKLIVATTKAEAAALGVHSTLDLTDRTKFGPDMEWIDGLDYMLDPARGEAFYQRIRRYWSGLPDGALQPDYTGVRPKIAGPGAPAPDFPVDGASQYGYPGYIGLYEIESLRLTNCLGIAEHVLGLIEAKTTKTAIRRSA